MKPVPRGYVMDCAGSEKRKEANTEPRMVHSPNTGWDKNCARFFLQGLRRNSCSTYCSTSETAVRQQQLENLAVRDFGQNRFDLQQLIAMLSNLGMR